MNAAKLEQAVLSLPASQRMHLVLAVWESMEDDGAIAADRSLDPEGVELAVQRDHEVASGTKQPLAHEEFFRFTGEKV